MKNVLEDTARDESFTQDDAKWKAHGYYISCMDVNGTIEGLGGKPLLNLLRQYMSGWHLLEKEPAPPPQDHEDDDDFVEAFTQKVAMVHHDLQSDGFFAWLVGGDDHNSSAHVIQIDQGGLSLPNREHYLNINDTKIVNSLKTVMHRLIKLLIADDTPADSPDAAMQPDQKWNRRILEEIDLIVEFETRLANITIPADQKRSDEIGSTASNRKTLGELNQQLSFINWTGYFGNAFDRINRSISNETEVVLYSLDFMHDLTDLIWEYANSTRGRLTLDSYMKWHVIKFVRNAMSKPYRDAGKVLEKALLGKEGHTERWRECVADTDVAIGYALGAMFVERVFHGKTCSSSF